MTCGVCCSIGHNTKTCPHPSAVRVREQKIIQLNWDKMVLDYHKLMVLRILVKFQVPDDIGMIIWEKSEPKSALLKYQKDMVTKHPELKEHAPLALFKYKWMT